MNDNVRPGFPKHLFETFVRQRHYMSFNQTIAIFSIPKFGKAVDADDLCAILKKISTNV
jgi:hypothetical protein